MAKRRKKKKALLTNVLKYEIYGIILITLSVIALSGEAAVGWSLSKMFGLVLGRFYFVIPLIGIYVGLSVMIQRKWPNRWSTRKSGIVLLVLALTLMSSVASLEKKLSHVPGLSAGHIITQIHNDLDGSLLSSAGSKERSMLNKDISGGYAYALQYAVLFWLFGNTGTKLMLIVMFIISFMLITNLSYVDLMRILRKRMVQAGSNVQKRIAAQKPQAVASSAKPSRKRGHAPLPDEDEDDDLDDFVEPRAKRSAPYFSSFLATKSANLLQEGRLRNRTTIWTEATYWSL